MLMMLGLSVDRSSDFDISVIVLKFNIRDVNSVDGWDINSCGEFFVSISNPVGKEFVEVSLESS